MRRITLSDAVHIALSQNRALKIARLKVTENEQKKAGQRSAYFPSIANQSNILRITDFQNIGIPAGAFGTAGGSLVPAQGVTIPQGRKTLFSSGTQLSQPLTQLIRIHKANQIAAAEVAVSRDDLKKAETEVALQVHTLYFGILIARLEKQAAEQQNAYATERLRESEDDVRNGSAFNVAVIQGKAGFLESQQSVLTAQLQLSDLNTELNDLLGLPLDTQLDLDPVVPTSFELRPRDEYLHTAWSENPEIWPRRKQSGKQRREWPPRSRPISRTLRPMRVRATRTVCPFLCRTSGRSASVSIRRCSNLVKDAQACASAKRSWRRRKRTCGG